MAAAGVVVLKIVLDSWPPNDCRSVNCYPMLAPAITLFLVLARAPVDSVASRVIPAPCPVIKERAIRYFYERDFYAVIKSVVDVGTKTKNDEVGARTEGDEIIVEGGRAASTPLAKPLSLNRSTIRKYTLPRHLSPFKTYDDFRAEGHLKLANATEGSCKATLRFEFSAFEFAWPLAAIDDGYRSKFGSNGTLEKLYLDSIDDLFKSR